MKFPMLFALAACVSVSAGEEFKCKEGARYVENECNNCFCTPTGVLACTEKACLGPRPAELHKCEVGTTHQKDCNKCWCAKDIGTLCTNNEC